MLATEPPFINHLAGDAHVAARPERGHEESHRGHEPEDRETDEREMDGRAPDEGEDALRDRLARTDGNGLGGGGQCPVTASVRNLRICQIITGMIRMSITTATAAP